MRILRGRSSAQRRPEITPGYDGLHRVLGHVAPLDRSTKAGDYPRLRRWGSARRRVSRMSAQRRPEITPGYDPSRPGSPGRRPPSLNEGRRLPPATTRVRRRTHQHDRGPRSTKAGDYPRLRRHGACGGNERPRHRSTKAGDYPRLRPLFPFSGREPPESLNEGRRLPPATTRIGPGTAPRPRPPPLNEGRRLPPATTRRSGDSRRATTSLNEGRRLPPATTWPTDAEK